MREFFIVVFGVMLPVLTLFFELGSRVCRDELFDPIPTPWHVAAVAFVATANLLALCHGASPALRWRNFLARVNGLAVGVALVYTIVFVPLAPIGVMLILIGIGFLLLAPLLSLIAALLARVALRDPAPDAPALPRLWLWTGLGVLSLFAIEIGPTRVQVMVHRATSEDEQERAAALEWLRDRDAGDRIRVEPTRRRPAMSLTGLLLPTVTPAEAAEVYFRVTGQRGPVVLDWRIRDPDEGGAAVSRPVAGLKLAHSRIEGEISENAGLVYLEWTMRFHNSGRREAEARATIDLPTGGVVSRVTLWVDGKPREATYSGTAHVREAYQSVVRQRRDPVLVTTSGPGQVLMQCFPVPEDGEMQVRLGVTAPLAQGQGRRWAAWIPRIAERNFDTPKTTYPEVAVTNGGLVRGEVLTAPPPLANVWAADPLDKGRAVRQSLRRERRPAVRRVVVVVDGSVAMRDSIGAVADALAALPGGTDLRLVVAGDVLLDLSESSDPVGELRRFRAVGGRDNVPALRRACRLVTEAGPAAIVWVRGPQPVLITPAEELQAELRRLPPEVTLYDVPVAPGANAGLAGEHFTPVVALPRRGELRDDLAALLRWLTTSQGVTRAVREKVALDEARASGAEGPGHLVRLWANEEVWRLGRAGELANRKPATDLAIKHRLVTPLTGAIVLETKEQYERAGLELPDDLKGGDYGALAASGHGPEPALWLLLAVVAGVVAVEWRRRRRVAVA